MTVYFITRNGDPTGAIKIGHSTDVGRRKTNLEVAIPEGVTVLATCDGGPEVEAYLHEMLEGHRIAREWFRPHSDVLRWVGQARSAGRLNLPIGADSSSTRRSSVDVQVSSDKLPFNAPAEIGALMRRHECSFAVASSHYCLNELVRREHRGRGDTLSAARDRVCLAAGIPMSAGFRVWHRVDTLNGVDADIGFRLHLLLAQCLDDEGIEVEYFSRFKAVVDKTDRVLRSGWRPTRGGDAVSLGDAM